MRRLTFFLAAVFSVLFAERALCHGTTFTIEPESFNSFRYEEMRAEEAAPLSIRRGRFLSVDPVLDVKRALKSPQMWNRYAYVRNNPVNAVDPTGKREANVYGTVLNVEAGYVVLLRDRETKKVVHVVVVGGFATVKGQKHPNALVWETVPVKGDANTSIKLGDKQKHTPRLVDSNSPAAGGAPGWNMLNYGAPAAVRNLPLSSIGPRGFTGAFFTPGDVAAAARNVGDVRFQVLASVTGTSFSDTLVSANKTYLYYVRAASENNTYVSAPSNSDPATTMFSRR